MFMNNLVRFRREANLSQSDLADKLGVARATYIKLEKGEKSPTLEDIKNISRILGVEVEDLIYEDSKSLHKNVEDKNINDIEETIKNKDIVFDDEKLKQALLYVIGEVGHMPNIGLTVIYKLLYFIDFDYYEKFSKSITGMKYMHNYYGPTPDRKIFDKLIEDMKNNDEIHIEKISFHGKMQKKYLPKNEFIDLGSLSGQEVNHINEVLDRMKHLTASQISDYAHRDTPWVLTKQGEVIDYKLSKYRTSSTSVVDDEDDL